MGKGKNAGLVFLLKDTKIEDGGWGGEREEKSGDWHFSLSHYAFQRVVFTLYFVVNS